MRGWARAVVGALLVLGGAGSVEAQVAGDTAQTRDTVQLVGDTLRSGDTLQVAPDSARMAVMRRLERLARRPGADSVLYVQDSLRLAQAAEGNRGGAGGADSVSTALLRMPGYSLTEYDAESADFDAGRRILVLQAPDGGRARVSQEGTVFEADTSIVFNEATGSIRAIGNGTFTPPEGDAVDAAEMIYDLNQGRGTARGARTSYAQDGANWIVRGDMPYAAPDSTFLAHAQFTSCDIEEPHYHFETDEIKIVAGNVLVARGVRLYFADVPVAWLPFMAQSLERGRRSGLLTPRFSVNDIVRTSGGYRRRLSNVGFYWAMSQYSDALVAMDWFSETFFALTSSVRYRFSRQFLEGNLSFRRYWRADGSTELALDTQHSWQIDERTQLRASGRFISNNDFLRQNSFNPREVTQSIDSEAGINRRFDWGTMSASANRKQYLSDDRTEWLLPSVNLSLSPITLFRAPPGQGGIFNHMTWSGSSGIRRNTVDRQFALGDTFDIRSANTVLTSGFARSNLSIGNLTFSQSVDLEEDRTLDVPEAFLLLEEGAEAPDIFTGPPAQNIADKTLGWSASLNYQQQLIGSTTLTPRLSVSGSLFQSDTAAIASSFVSAPSRVSFGAQLRTDIYGFFGGVGPFEAIRHKISPSFDYQWSPATEPTQLQRDVFGTRFLQPKNAVSVSLTQTFEAKRRQDEDEEAPESQQQGGVVADSLAGAGRPLGQPPGSQPQAGSQAGSQSGARGAQDGPRRMQTTPSVTLLAWRTSVIRYDFVEADSVGAFLAGFETTRLSNQFSSDYLRGLSISMDHELFDDQTLPDGSPGSRTFDPHLSQVNLSFSLGSRSSIFRWLGLSGGGGGDDEPEEPDTTDPLAEGPTDESMIVPVAGQQTARPQPQAGRGSSGGWSANLSYSLQRPRDPLREASQMLSGTVRLEPTENWSVSWRTAYDLEVGAFNDHSIRLTRDLHRWQANFDFLQTATGNWSFRFEVSLMDNRDLKFDYKQRNLDLGLPSDQR
ncbi:MAG: putative LPS assembly protein LptD [Longimicrobiales bacterium]|nr:putative LPS assembly protein LptD [Longimicrobiales bacterium]